MKKPAKLLLGVVRVLIGAALCWVVVTRTGGWKLALSAFSTPIALLAVSMFSFLGAYIEALRITPLLGSTGVSVSVNDAFRLSTAAFAFNFCIPGGASGDLSKVYYLRAANPGSGWELATIVFVDRLVGLLSMLLLIAALGLADWSLVKSSLILWSLFWVTTTLILGILLFAACCMSKKPFVRRLTLKILTLLPFRSHLERVANVLFHFGDHLRTLVLSLFVSLLGNVAGATAFAIFGWALYPHAAFLTSTLLSMFGMFANTITVTPGGLGVGEAAFDRLFLEAGLSGGAAVMILWRLSMLPLCLLGLGFYIRGLQPGGREFKRFASRV